VEIILQNIVFPNKYSYCDNSLYYIDKFKNCCVSNDEHNLFIPKGNTVIFRSYFNLFSIKGWNRIRKLNFLKLRLSFKGNLLLTFWYVYKRNSTTFLNEYNLYSNGVEEVNLDITDISDYSDGYIYFDCYSYKDSYLYSACYETDISDSVRKIKMAIVITHFNRQKQITRTIKKLSETIDNSSDLKNVKLIIVDNSCNLSVEDSPYLKVIKNKNFGGSGGFTRGLLYAEDHDFSHCLFMDDDANCDVEGIFRTLRFLELSKDEDNIAIAGSLFYKENPNVIHEKGATFDIICKPICCDYDLSNIDNLLIVENDDTHIDYGAWCYFAFDIKQVKKYPYPFFVRGDDILFSLVNKFNIVTLNGIATWIDSFDIKESLITRYLHIRAESVICALLGHDAEETFMYTKKEIYRLLYTYQYEEASAIILAVQEFLKGPKIFTQDMEGVGFRNKISLLKGANTFVNSKKFPHASNSKHISRLMKFFICLSLHGCLLPSFLFHKTPRIIDAGNIYESFLNKNIIFQSKFPPYYAYSFDRKKCIQGIIKVVKLEREFYKNYDKVKKMYLSNAQELMNKEFWKSKFDI